MFIDMARIITTRRGTIFPQHSVQGPRFTEWVRYFLTQISAEGRLFYNVPLMFPGSLVSLYEEDQGRYEHDTPLSPRNELIRTDDFFPSDYQLALPMRMGEVIEFKWAEYIFREESVHF